ncbi:MAG: hypothetical protein IPG71_01400 [bacterium]|nr:hypothetical protein [bacterium]
MSDQHQIIVRSGVVPLMRREIEPNFAGAVCGSLPEKFDGILIDLREVNSVKLSGDGIGFSDAGAAQGSGLLCAIAVAAGRIEVLDQESATCDLDEIERIGNVGLGEAVNFDRAAAFAVTGRRARLRAGRAGEADDIGFSAPTKRRAAEQRRE